MSDLKKVFKLNENVENESLKKTLGSRYKQFQDAVNAFRKDWAARGEDPDSVYYGDDYVMHSVFKKDGNTVIHFNERAGGNSAGDVVLMQNGDVAFPDSGAKYIAATKSIEDTDEFEHML